MLLESSKVRLLQLPRQIFVADGKDNKTKQYHRHNADGSSGSAGVALFLARLCLRFGLDGWAGSTYLARGYLCRVKSGVKSG